MPPADDPAAWARLVGQIVIFTLLDGSVPAFDAMMGSVTEQVRAGSRARWCSLRTPCRPRRSSASCMRSTGTGTPTRHISSSPT
jgi:hypothetical protein